MWSLKRKTTQIKKILNWSKFVIKYQEFHDSCITLNKTITQADKNAIKWQNLSLQKEKQNWLQTDKNVII